MIEGDDFGLNIALTNVLVCAVLALFLCWSCTGLKIANRVGLSISIWMNEVYHD